MGEFFNHGAISNAFFKAPGWHPAREELAAAGVALDDLRSGGVDLEQALTAVTATSAAVVRDQRPRLEHYVVMLLRVLSAEAVRRKVPLHSKVLDWLGQPACIISLNYDILMDHALELTERWYPRDGYCVGFSGQTQFNDTIAPMPESPPSATRLLKLHGSLSWLRGVWRSRRTGDLPGGGMISEMVPTDDLFFTRSPYAPLQPYEEDEGASLGPREDHFIVFPYVVAPGKGKTAKNRPHLPEVWREAHDRLRVASDVLIWGCSFREDDADLADLLREGLRRPRSKPVPVSVVDLRQEVAARIGQVLQEVAPVQYRGADILSLPDMQ